MIARLILLLTCLFASSATAGERTLAAEFEQTQLRWFLATAHAEAQRAVETGESKAGADASARVRLVIEAWRKSPCESEGNFAGDAHSRANVRSTFLRDFFSWHHFFATLAILDRAGALDPALRAGGEALAQDILRPLERGPNNRAYHFALGAAYAATLFPHAAEATGWRAYAEAVWNDWWIPGDTYEPGYIAHHFPQIIELGEVLGHEHALRSDRARLIFSRFRDHVSASGLAVQAADPGGPDTQSSYAYVEGLCAAARLLRDGSFLGAAQRALAATPARPLSPNDFDRAALERIVARTTRALAAEGIAPEPPRALVEVQKLFPATHAIADRLLLSTPGAPAQPYVALDLNDRMETLFHGHEDIRGNILHYEAGGVLYLRGPGWAKWTGAANTFTVADARAEFPLAQTRGLEPRRWYAASGNLRLLRYFQPNQDWQRTADSATEQYQTALRDMKTGLGYAWANPGGFAGEFEQIEVDEVTLRFIAIPAVEARAAQAKRDHFLYTLSFDPHFFWYREYGLIAPADGALDYLVRNLRLAGPQGEEILASFTSIPENIVLRYFAPGTRGQAPREIPRGEWAQFLQITATDEGPALRVTCPPGRLDLVLRVPKRRIDVTKEFSRIGFDYQLITPTTALLRTPVSIAVNGLRPRSFYLDGQQGGVLTDSRAEVRADDRAGIAAYEGVYSHDSRWTRRIVLTREGVLAVLDEFTAGPALRDSAGGPVWQLPFAPQRGNNWMDSAAEQDPAHRLLAFFHPQAGTEFGVQVQARFNRDATHAAFARRALGAGKTERFLTVLLPHAAGLPAAELAARLSTVISPEGVARIALTAGDARGIYPPLAIEFFPDGTWTVTRP